MREIINQVEEKLRAGDSKLTPRREHILRVLLENKDKHLSAEEIYHLVKQRAPDVGLATVYRTLELFCDFDIIHSIDFGDGRKRYEFGGAQEKGHHHHHLICTRCGKITEVNEDLLEELELRVTKLYDFTIVDHELKFFGYCRDCTAKMKGEEGGLAVP
ncbi:Fur family transcriptional regulator [Desulfovirgula thermocuniculi]|uniref:Fur family transcriptional regulator n=1 Tax=Desulfovirgula thermocuniculi TaxID=348842 RepID=UPI00041BCE9E|nr:transcriptional repressor [Desulfovirgula thermocuniculi]